MAFRRRVGVSIVTAIFIATVAVGTGVGPFAGGDAGAQTASITELMLGLENGVAAGASSELVGWSLGAIGLNSSQNQEFEVISAQLAEISEQLTDIENELVTLNDDIETQTCALETFDTTTSARAQIDTLTDELQQFQAAGATSAQIDGFVHDVLNGSSSIPDAMNVINDALLNAGTADGIITSCLATIAAPASGTVSDIDYYELVSNLTNFFYGYQVRGLNLIDEAYHAQAMSAWLSANPTSSVSVDDIDTICTGATGTLAVYCDDAVYWTQQVYDNLEDQYALAGAPYTVDGASLTVNDTPYLLATSLEGFTAAQGSSCALPLTSADPCGPLAGTNLTTTIDQPNEYGNRSDWVPSVAQAWQPLLVNWTESDQTLGEYLEGLGFSDTTSSTKVWVTSTTYTAMPKVNINDSETVIFSSPAVCFGDTSLERSVGHQPFCFNGSNDGDDYGEASDLLEHVDELPPDGDCLSYSATAALTDEDTNGWYDGTFDYKAADPCNDNIWENGVEPGWLLDDSGASQTQYVWPMFDMSTATCNTNDDGSARSTTNAVGVYTMCGDDFDTWFAAIVPAPTASTPSASVSPAVVAPGGSTTLTSVGSESGSDLTVTLNSTPIVLDITQADDHGHLQRSYTVPADIEPGAHTIDVVGTTRAGDTYTVTIDLVVAPALVPRFTG